MPKKSWGYPFVDGIHVHFQFLFVYFGCGTGYLFPCPDVTTVPYHLVQLQRSLVLILASFPHSLVRISLYINKGSSGLAVLFNRIVSKRKCIRNHWKQQTDEIKKSAFCSYEMFFSRKANLFLGGRLRLFFLLCSISIGFGVNSKGCGDNSKGYGDNSKAYGDRNRTAGKP